MYKHILVATDGSRLSQKAIRTAARLADSLGARLTGVYVIPPYTPPAYGEAVIYVPGVSPQEYRKLTERSAKKALAAVEIEAGTLGVKSAGVFLTADNAWEGILKTAKSKKCDAIVMASHGRRGLAGLILGSETVKVLTHSKIPVLVVR